MDFSLECGLHLELLEDFTAVVINSQKVKGSICIPRSINYQSHEYVITAIEQNSFKNSSIKSIQFADDSEILFIGNEAFSSSSISSIRIPSRVIHIGDRAFYGCLSLSTVEFSENSELRSIGKEAFAYSSIRKIFLPNHVNRIAANTFYECRSLTTIEIPKDSELQVIEKDAFLSSSLESIYLPSTVEVLEDGWCNGTLKLINVDISEENEFFSIYEKKMILEKKDGVYESIIFASRDITKAFIPSSVKFICSQAFSKCRKFLSIEIPENSNLISIGNEAFFDSCIKSIFIPKHVKQIEKSAFYGCNLLKEIQFAKDSELLSIGKEAFTFSSFKRIEIPSHVTQIGDRAFADCYNLKEIEIPENSELNSIGVSAFFCSSLQNLSIPSKLIELKSGWCCGTSKLVNIKVSTENKLFSIYENKMILRKKDDIYESVVFACRDITKAFIPKSIKCIESQSFSSCKKLKTIEFPSDSKVSTIGAYGIAYSSIESIVVPQEAKYVFEHSFAFCSKLKTAEFLGNDLLFGGYVFEQCTSLFIVSFPNAQQISINDGAFSAHQIDFMLFMCAKAKISFSKKAENNNDD